jgi:hypothetical protein
MALPTLPILPIEVLRQAALTRLRAGVAAANVPGADPSALKSLYIPRHRFEKLGPERAPLLHVVAKTDGGEGLSHELPLVASVGTLHINILLASGRSGAVDLDVRAAQLTQAVCLLLLEDQTFLEQFAYVEALRVSMEDGIARGDGGEFDVVLVQIELVMAEGQTQFEPRLPPNDFAQVDMTTDIGPVIGSDPPQDHTVRLRFEPEE